ncbi:MAG: hypothetical protein OXR73_32445 [Myxococcales bacterium]|nr:hypothetical protein [Myxococcales bacterium]
MVARARAALYGTVSAAPAFLWDPDLQLMAFVRATRARRGHLARVTVGHSRLRGERLRAALEERSGLSLRFQGDVEAARGDLECGPDACSARVRFPAPDVFVVEQGRWLALPGADGVETVCAALAKERGDALELVARRGDARTDGALVPLLRSRGFVIAYGRAIRAVRRDRLPTPEAAEAVVSARLTQPLLSLPGGMPAEVVGDLRRRADGTTAITELKVSFDDLQLLADDARRNRAAQERARALTAMRPGSDVNVHDLDALIQQVQYRVQALERTSGEERQAVATSLRGLLERAVPLHPRRRDLARLLARVLLEELSAGGAAVSFARAQQGLPGADPAFWALALRHGLALSDRAKLSSELVRAGLVSVGQASEVAGEIAALVRAGTPFDLAEDAALVALQMEASSHPLRPPTDAVRVSELPVPELLESLCMLAELSGIAEQAWVGVHSPVPAGVVTGADLQVVALPGRDVRAVARLDLATCGAAARLGRALARLPAGEWRLHFMLADPTAQSRIAVLLGHASAGRFRLVRADRQAAALSWSRLAQVFVTPLVGLSQGELVIPVVRGMTASNMLGLAEGAFGLACRTERARIRCPVASGARERARRALQAIFSDLLQSDALLFWRG